MQHRVVFAAFLLFCMLGHLALAVIQTCTSELEANSNSTKSKVTIKKGITYPWKEAGKVAVNQWADCTKQTECFTELGKDDNVFQLKTLTEKMSVRNGTKNGNTWHKFICIPLGKGFNGTLQINMMYHCEDAVNGKEITATKVLLNPAKPEKHTIPLACP